MLKKILFCLSVFHALNTSGQSFKTGSPYDNKGKLFISWGWNRSAYTRSDIHFRGQDYNFTLKDVVAKDRPTPFTLRYFNPSKMTIPQYNFRIGYYLTPKYSLSFGFDHMKYVMSQNQTVRINGSISATGTSYDHQYVNEDIVLTDKFLQFEHTNGLNYLNLELRRTDHLLGRKELKVKNIDISLIEGFGAGILYPKTDVTLLNYERNDQWHLAGYGFDLIAGVKITFFKHFFVQGEAKGGFITMPDILTTNYPDDHASQHFFFSQANVNLGVQIKL